MKRTGGIRLPSPSMLVALVALVVALGGTSYAAFSLPKNSVGTRQLKRGAVTTKKIKNGAVTAAKINTQGLVVPTARRAFGADHATTAVHASSADIATNAANANHASTADSASTGSAVAYAHVLANGTLDGANSKNVTVVSALGSTYCLNVGVGVRNVAGTVDATSSNGFMEAAIRGQGSSSTIDSNCASSANVVVFTLSNTGGEAAEPFWVTFN